jgi:outer membrane lipoprotein-sorting protein
LLFSFKSSFAQETALIEKTKSNYRKIKSISAKCRKTSLSHKGIPETIFFIQLKKGAGLRIDFLEPLKMVYLDKKDSLYIYIQDKNQYAILEKSRFSVLEKETVKSINLVNLDHFSNMERDYQLKVFDTLPSGVVVSAEPKTGWKHLSRILIKVDTNYYAINALELFAKNGKLFSQTIYSKFQHFKKKGVYFPSQITSRNIVKDYIVEERIVLSRIQINTDLPDSLFQIKVPANAKKSKKTGLLEMLSQ